MECTLEPVIIKQRDPVEGLSLRSIDPSFNREPVSVWTHDRTLTSGRVSKDFIFLTYGITKSEFSFQESLILFSRFPMNSVFSFAENPLKTMSFFSPIYAIPFYRFKSFLSLPECVPLGEEGLEAFLPLFRNLLFGMGREGRVKKVSNISR